MKYIKTYEAVNGHEVTVPFGPVFGRQNTPNTISTDDTHVIVCPLDDKLYTYDQYDLIYNDYITHGGKALTGFNVDNLNTVVAYLDDLESSNENINPDQYDNEYSIIPLSDNEMSYLKLKSLFMKHSDMLTKGEEDEYYIYFQSIEKSVDNFYILNGKTVCSSIQDAIKIAKERYDEMYNEFTSEFNRYEVYLHFDKYNYYVIDPAKKTIEFRMHGNFEYPDSTTLDIGAVPETYYKKYAAWNFRSFKPMMAYMLKQYYPFLPICKRFSSNVTYDISSTKRIFNHIKFKRFEKIEAPL